MKKCLWSTKNDWLEEYHDFEWGVPILESQQLFESFALEIFQAGLNWEIILKKRSALREALCQFNPYELSNYTEDEVTQLLKNTEIIRNERKIRAVLHNARVVTRLSTNFSDYIWQFVDFKPIRATHHFLGDEKSRLFLMQRVVQQMQLDGFVFVGPKMLNSFFQATGLINDHEETCFRYYELSI